MKNTNTPLDGAYLADFGIDVKAELSGCQALWPFYTARLLDMVSQWTMIKKSIKKVLRKNKALKEISIQTLDFGKKIA